MSKGPVQQEIEARLREALSPQELVVSNDSAQHHGHAGDDGSGESHFSVHIVSTQFEGKSRVERQRMVNHALAELLKEKVHALAIKATPPA